MGSLVYRLVVLWIKKSIRQSGRFLPTQKQDTQGTQREFVLIGDDIALDETSHGQNAETEENRRKARSKDGYAVQRDDWRILVKNKSEYAACAADECHKERGALLS